MKDVDAATREEWQWSPARWPTEVGDSVQQGGDGGGRKTLL